MTRFRGFQVLTGDARREGRAPAHDGEFLFVMYSPDLEGAFTVSGNGGCMASDIHSLVDACVVAGGSDEDIAEMAELDQEIAEGIAADDGADLLGPEAAGVEALGYWLDWLAKEEEN